MLCYSSMRRVFLRSEVPCLVVSRCARFLFVAAEDDTTIEVSGVDSDDGFGDQEDLFADM